MLEQLAQLRCTTDGQDFAEPIDWAERSQAIAAIPVVRGDFTARDAARTALHAERRAVTSHLVQHGGRPLHQGKPATDAELAAGADLTCPVCRAPLVRRS